MVKVEMADSEKEAMPMWAKQGEDSFTGDQSGIKRYDDEILQDDGELLVGKHKSYEETLLGGEGFDQMETLMKDMDSEEGDFSGFSIIEESNNDILCLNFLISKKDEDKICKL